LHPRFLFAPLFFVILAIAHTGCGVSFHDQFFGTELFRSLEIDGEKVVDSDLTVTIMYTQGYPVPVRVACYYEDGSRLTEDQQKLAFQERATKVGETVLPAAEGERPGTDLPEKKLSFHFSIDEPGNYFLACLTPAAPENGLGQAFEIRSEKDATSSSSN
jgi:hypothetical protein